jgi:transcriptional regulator with XRE-family HTH domain
MNDSGLKKLRQQRLLTQREVAEQAKITVTTLSRIENGRTIPSFKTIRNLATVFQISPQEMKQIIVSYQMTLEPINQRLIEEKPGYRKRHNTRL